MIIWVDAQISPAIAKWIDANCAVSAAPIRDFGLRDATDLEIFRLARQADAVVMTKDGDFVQLVDRLGPPPKVIWVTCGDTSNLRLKEILTKTLPKALDLLRQGEKLVEINSI